MRQLLMIGAGLAVLLGIDWGRSYAKPMMPPTPKQAVQSALIAVCEYVSCDEGSAKTYFGGAMCRYKVVKALKGDKPGEAIAVRYDFHDGTPCIAPPEWKFDEKIMPRPGSRWILFLTPGPKPGDPFTTYRGDYGRWDATPARLEQVEKLLAPPKGPGK